MNSTKNGWARRPGLSRLLDAALFLTPVAASSAVLWWLARQTQGAPGAVRIPVLLLVAGLAGLGVERLMRHLIPLATLMRLTMVFPDEAPSRMSVARLAGNPTQLKTRLASEDLDESEAAKTILALVASLARHDRKTRGHSERVRVYTDMLSVELGLTDGDRDRLRWAALLHDVGKLDVDPHILQKPSKPTAAEWSMLKQHPLHGAELAGPLLPWLGEWGRGIVEHHERYDGNGYPSGLKGAEISWGARIISVADSFETMTAVRPYKQATSHRLARIELAECAGSQFDPVVVRAFLGLSLPAVLRAMGPVAALVQLPFASTIQFAGVRVAEVSAVTAVVAAPAIAVGLVAGPIAPGANVDVPTSVALPSPQAPVAAARVSAPSVLGLRNEGGTQLVVLAKEAAPRPAAAAPQSRKHDKATKVQPGKPIKAGKAAAKERKAQQRAADKQAKAHKKAKARSRGRRGLASGRLLRCPSPSCPERAGLPFSSAWSSSAWSRSPVPRRGRSRRPRGPAVSRSTGSLRASSQPPCGR